MLNIIESQDSTYELVVYLYYAYACRVTENKIKKILEEAGIIISAGKISNILTQEKKEELTKEREVILKAGLESSSYFHIGDTGLKHEVQEIKSAHRLPSRPAQKQKVPHACVGIAFYDLLDSCFYIRVY